MRADPRPGIVKRPKVETAVSAERSAAERSATEPSSVVAQTPSQTTAHSREQALATIGGHASLQVHTSVKPSSANALGLRLPAGLPPGVTKQALTDFIAASSDAQWFTGKGKVVKSVEIAERAAVDLGTLRCELALLDVKYDDGTHDVFHVPLIVNADGTLRDALEEPAFVRAMVDAARAGANLTATSGTVQARGSSTLPDARDLEVKALGVPQSNVSIRVGDGLIFKAYRKPEVGITIEREVTTHLSEQKYRNTPELLGTLTMDTKNGPMTIAMIFELVKSDGDGWKHTLEGLKNGDPKLVDGLALLGQRIGEMHKALGATVADPAFAPRAVDAADLTKWSAAIARELDETIAAARAKDPALADKLESAKPRLRARLDALENLDATLAGKKTRIHGDLHLGQVLHRASDWLVLDFEGEPARTKEERRGFYTPLRDVAGMLRSFHYAEAEAKAPEGFAKAAGAAFLDRYRAAVAGTDLVPDDPAAFTTLLAAVELEKALYEVRYELKSRPTWVHIPASRVLAMADER